MSTEANIREQIQAILQGVEGIGVVHAFDRATTDMAKFLSRYQDATGRINGIQFRRTMMAKRTVTIGGQKERVHVYTLRAIMGLQDAQETGILFDDLLSRIEAEFDAHPNLNGACHSTASDWGPMAGVAGVQIETSDDRMFGNVLCHYGELRLAVVERNLR